MKISVTGPMIAFGKRCDSFDCPLAKAFAVHGFDVMISVDHVDFYDRQGNCSATLPLPPSAQWFQRQFDDGSWMQPFEFEMPELTPGVLPSTDFASSPVVV